MSCGVFAFSFGPWEHYRACARPGRIRTSAQAIVRIELDGDRAREVERFPMGARIRSLVEGPDGAIWVLEDERRDSQGRLLKLTPR